MTDEEFKQRWIARVMERVPEFTIEDAENAWEACEPSEHREGFENEPEDAADEEMSYWD